ERSFDTLSKRASSNFLFQFVSVGLDLAWEGPFVDRVESAVQLVFIEPAIVELLLIEPTVRSDPAKEICHFQTRRGGVAINQIAQMVPFPEKQFGREDA